MASTEQGVPVVYRGNKRHQLIFNKLSVVLVASDLFTDNALSLIHAGLETSHTATEPDCSPL